MRYDQRGNTTTLIVHSIGPDRGKYSWARSGQAAACRGMSTAVIIYVRQHITHATTSSSVEAPAHLAPHLRA